MTMKLRQWVLGAVLLSALVPSAAPADEMSVVWDNFANGFSVDTAGAKWTYFKAGGFTGNNGLTTPYAGGMYVRAPGTNPSTGKPAYTLSVAPEASSGLPGGIDHVKWLAYMNTTSSWGFPGFNVGFREALECSTSLSAQTFGTEYHPFGGLVSNAQDDLRLAGVAMNTVDFESNMVFDFMLTNQRVYVIYERLPFGRTATNHYAAFTYAIPVKARTPSQTHQMTISYDRMARTVTWILDGVVVFTVTQPGYRIDRQWMVIDHGGTEQAVVMRQLNCGMGMFSLLDGSMNWGAGLVRLSSTPGFYFLPPVGTSSALSFADETSQHSSRLFGQGAAFTIGPYYVTRYSTWVDPCPYDPQYPRQRCELQPY
ncbi:DUF6081 family protein [Hyalangium rubrum]|uniref:DUF6081 family protein n=1 Tax=Hyalangium rubrum TaxID=3103134 RepID=A0ABU5H773_9BACT|nr:DUF6081 family protein [Hyalangium sp. s54d21]MDY7229322.1 DUF6081 family protein [Hyalangium sp. s54d21]